MKLLLQACLLNCLMLVSVHAATMDNLAVSDGYVRGLPPTVENTAAYLRLTNTGDEQLILTGARTSVAERVTLHETRETDNGQVTMRPLDTVAIPPGGELILETGGKHFMLMGLDLPLSEGDRVEFTLIFEGGLEKTVTVPVRSVLSEAQQN